MGDKEAVIDFAKQAFQAEFMTPPGVVNVIGVFTTFLLALFMGLLDAGQLIIGWIDEGYESDLPSSLWFLGTHVLLIAVCTTLLLLLLEKRPN